ncbi:TBP-associated factor 3 [Cochliomyia hominivorax]
MSDQYMKDILRVAVAQICQTIGYNATQTAPLELLQDVLDKFLKEFTRDLRRQVEHYNRTEANLNDVTLTLSSINVNLNELLDYINNVEPVPFALEVPKFPARKDSALNFLKPGSKEVLTRPVHVYDHLPPMLPPEITQTPEVITMPGGSNVTDSKENLTANTNGEQNNDAANKSLNASNVLDKSTLQSLFKPSTNFEDGERPTREVSSVVMTTGGYISPAVEGKMPEAIVPDIIDKLLGLDAPPPPPPPPPPSQPKPVPRSSNNTPGPINNESSNSNLDKEANERDAGPSTSKETKKALARSLEPQPVTNRKADSLHDIHQKKNKLFNPCSSGKNFPPDLHLQPIGNYNKKSFMMHQNHPANMSTPQTNYANMLLKKAKKQKVPLMAGQTGLSEKPHIKPLSEKIGKMDAAEKAHRKYTKMLQKMAKQGKIPPELLGNIMGPDKKSKMINPAIVASMPPGPEKMQLEKLLRKQAKQRQKMLKQQMLMEAQKQSKKPMAQPPPLVPLFPPRMPEAINKPLNKPLQLEMEEQKLKLENKEVVNNISPVKSGFTDNLVSPGAAAKPGNLPLSENLLTKSHKTPTLPETPVMEMTDNNAKPLLTGDGKELKLNNEPDRSKLNIFKKISKQKTPKSSSPTPMRLTGLNDTPIINLPSGTTITPAPGPTAANNNLPQTPTLNNPAIGRNLFPPLNDNQNLSCSNIINVDDIKDKTNLMSASNSSTVAPTTTQPTDLSMLNRVFGEKPPEVEMANKPKKRGRKPGSKNSPKIPGVFPNNLLKKTSKKLKLDNANLFANQITQPQQLPPDFGAAAAMGNLSFDNVAQLFGNHMNPLEWAQNKHLQQQMMIMAGAKERKEHKKKSKILKQQEFLHAAAAAADNNLTNINKLSNTTSLTVPTSEEVQSINKKLMRMDTILKATPSNSSTTEEVQSINKKLMRMDTIMKAASSNTSNTSSTDLTVDTSLITGKKLPSPSVFPSSTSPLKSPGNSKRLLAGAEAAMAASSLVQPFMLPQRPAFPNLPSNMLSMLQFPFPPRPGLIPTPGLFPTPGLGAFANNPKNPLLPGLFPFPNLKQSSVGDSATMNQDSEDLSSDKKKSESNLQTSERSYCNVAPLVPDFLTKFNDNNANNNNNSGGSNKHSSHEPPNAHEPDLPKTPKPRNSHSNSLTQDNLLKKMVDAHTPESASGSISGKSIPSTPGGMSLNTFEQLMKKNESPIDLMALNKQNKALSGSQESGLDFSMNKKTNHSIGGGAGGGGGGGAGVMGGVGGLSVKTPITLNNEPIEVSDDSDETSQPPAPPIKNSVNAIAPLTSGNLHSLGGGGGPGAHNQFNMDDMFVANTSNNNPTHLLNKSMESDLTTKELKKLKKQVKKSSSSITASLMNVEKGEGLTVNGPPATATGVGKLAGGADLIPLTSTGMAYSSKNIPYNSLTANANPSFSVHKTDFNSSATAGSTSQGASTTATGSVFDNLTITAAIPTPSGSVSSGTSEYDLQKKRKEHKKLKKLKELKEGKIKKKKDKKDKNKDKDKVKKYLLNPTQTSPLKEKDTTANLNDLMTPNPSLTNPILMPSHTSSSGTSVDKEKIKDKDLIKKLKKEKKKEKQRTNLEDLSATSTSSLSHNTSTLGGQALGGPTAVSSSTISATASHKDLSAGGISAELEHTKKPKSSTTALTINTNDQGEKLNPSLSTPTASLVPKLTLKLGSTHSPTPPREDGHKTSSVSSLTTSNTSTPQATAAATTSTGAAAIHNTPPREPVREPSPELARISPLVTRPPKHKLNTSGELAAGSSSTSTSISATNSSSLDITDTAAKTSSSASNNNANMIVPPPSPWLSGGTISASSVLLPHQLLQTTKQHDISTTPASSSHSNENTSKASSSDRQSPLTLITETSRPSSYIDAEGNRVWICPACGKVDDGSPMIGCDGCDAWYHWVCVGIFVAPKDNEDWFCRVCITRKKGLHGSDKKRKRNKKK